MSGNIERKPGPLAGVNVLDFTWVLAGPHATKSLADMGANVIKVEQFKAGANERWLPLRIEHNGVTQSSYSINNNRGKRSMCVNMKNPKGMKIITELIKKSDFLIENFAPGVMHRLNLDYDQVKKIKEDIIYCSISSFGHAGPYSHKPGYDMIAQGASGWSAQSDPEIIAPVSIGDTTAAMHACTAMLAALHHREKTGVGQYLDISMMDCLFSLHENSLPWYMIGEATGHPIVPKKIGAKHPGYAPYGIYNGKNGTIVIACLTEPRWKSLVNLMGPDYAWLKDEPRAKDVSTRCTVENAPLVHEQIEKWVMEQDSVEEAERKLDEADVPSLRVRGLVELATSDEHVKAREMVRQVYQPFIGTMMMYGSPLKFSETPSGIRGYAPFLGEHNRQILEEDLGYSSSDVDSLYQEDILFHEAAVDKLSDELATNGLNKVA